MADSVSVTKKGCLKRGCFGCLILGGAGVGLILVLALITVIRGTPEVVREDAVSTHSIPQGNWDVAQSGEPLIVDPDQIGRVVLDVSFASLSIVPASPGTPVRLDAHYDSGKYSLEESIQTEGELGWTYRVSFGRRSIFDFRHSQKNRLELHLPAGTPLVLEGKIGVGESNLELGGLWLESVDLDIGIGEHRIDFDEPLSSPMSRFVVRGSIGETRIRNLGNASPAEIRVTHSLGELRVDLDGAWQNDSTVTVRSSIGACSIGLPPEEIGFELLGARLSIGDSNTRVAGRRPEPPPGAPVVRLKASHSLGELLLTD